MPPKPAPVSCFLLRFESTTILLPVTSSTTLSTLRKELLNALKSTHSPEAQPQTLPKSTSDIALWKGDTVSDSEEKEWTQLTDESSGADKWGLSDADEIGVSFKEDGDFPTPIIIRPVDEPES